MTRILALIISAFLLFSVNSPAKAVELSALDIFDSMIHFESDQLTTTPSTRDYHCSILETTTRTTVETREIKNKDLYFMVPTFQLQLIDNEPVFYFDDDLLIVLLESVDLQKLRDAVINDIPCYVIKSIPKDPAFAIYNRTYYVAQDNFRHVRTVAEHATLDYDNLNTVIDYTYDTFDGFTLLSKTVSETRDSNSNVLATVTTEYSNYEFGLGLTIDFFANYLQDTSPNTPLD
jgi:hypothetical protein